MCEITKVLPGRHLRAERDYSGKVQMRNAGCKILYLFGKTNARADAAVFLTIPPTTIGPTGVDTIPRVSVRTSRVSWSTISHCLLCTSKENVSGETSGA